MDVDLDYVEESPDHHDQILNREETEDYEETKKDIFEMLDNKKVDSDV